MALENEHVLLKSIAKFLQRHADLIIVTNKKLKQIVEDNKGRGFVLPDNVPEIESKSSSVYVFDHQYNLVFICTYASDEPYEEVFKAAEKIIKQSDLDIGVYVTGKVPKIFKNKAFSNNLHLLGFVSWNDYDSLLESCDGIIDLTTRENCLVCGAYEAVAVEKPAILSKTEALQGYFTKGFCFSDNTADSLAKSMLYLIENNQQLTIDIKELKPSLNNNWAKMKNQLLKDLEAE